MSQNRSSAVMQQRVEAHDSLDDFPTPPFATRALCEWLSAQGYELRHDTVREPAANRGFMVKPLEESFGCVVASDVHDYGASFPVADYLWGDPPNRTDWTITNPPFRLAEAFAHRALASSDGVAFICRSAFTEGGDRYTDLFKDTPPDFILQFCERVVMLKGRMVRSGATDPFHPEGKKASTATAYSWFVWLPGGRRDTRFRWIAPCRRRLEREGDYPDYADATSDQSSSPTMFAGE